MNFVNVPIGYLVIALSQNKIMLFTGNFLKAVALTLHVPVEGKIKIWS